jgi:hypothetical protein
MREPGGGRAAQIIAERKGAIVQNVVERGGAHGVPL